MDPKPAPASQKAAGGERDGDATRRYGPLELRRLRKDDGRQLIVYSRPEAPADGGTP